MLIQSLVTAFIVAFIAIAMLGHVLLLRAIFAPGKARSAANAADRSSHHAPVAGTRIAA